jgi:hypothetical protein
VIESRRFLVSPKPPVVGCPADELLDALVLDQCIQAAHLLPGMARTDPVAGLFLGKSVQGGVNRNYGIHGALGNRISGKKSVFGVLEGPLLPTDSALARGELGKL